MSYRTYTTCLIALIPRYTTAALPLPPKMLSLTTGAVYVSDSFDVSKPHVSGIEWVSTPRACNHPLSDFVANTCIFCILLVPWVILKICEFGMFDISFISQMEPVGYLFTLLFRAVLDVSSTLDGVPMPSSIFQAPSDGLLTFIT